MHFGLQGITVIFRIRQSFLDKMRPLRVLFAITALLAIVFTALGPSAVAVAYRSDLKHGDLAWYSRSGSGAYSLGAPTLQVVVLNVTGSTVYGNFTNYFSDGYVNSTVFWVDYLLGYTNARDLLFVTGTGLRVGDPVYQGQTSNITQVQSLSCGGIQRNVDIAFNPLSSAGVRIGWDQATGMMCNFFLQDSSGFQYLTMSNTTLWSSTSPPPTNAFLTAFAVSSFLGVPLVVLVILAYFRRRRSRRKS